MSTPSIPTWESRYRIRKRHIGSSGAQALVSTEPGVIRRVPTESHTFEIASGT